MCAAKRTATSLARVFIHNADADAASMLPLLLLLIASSLAAVKANEFTVIVKLPDNAISSTSCYAIGAYEHERDGSSSVYQQPNTDTQALAYSYFDAINHEFKFKVKLERTPVFWLIFLEISANDEKLVIDAIKVHANTMATKKTITINTYGFPVPVHADAAGRWPRRVFDYKRNSETNSNLLTVLNNAHATEHLRNLESVTDPRITREEAEYVAIVTGKNLIE